MKGCYDPTGKIPANKVFISGYTSDGNNRELFGKVHKRVYVSRSPCLEPDDAKMLSVVGSKPKEMTAEDWRMLCSYGFGTIIFPKPRHSHSVPLPCMIADGDLDGDDYFVLWDEGILNHLMNAKDQLTSKSRKLLNKLELPTGAGHSIDKRTKCSPKPDPRWLSKAQSLMLDFQTQNMSNQCVGKLFGCCSKASQRDDGSVDLFDKDAIAYARAYKDALDAQKHGGKIKLPLRLHHELPRSVQAVLMP